MTPEVVSEATLTIRAPRATTFERVAPIDLPSIFRGYGPLPAVVATEGQTGAWDAAGQTRRIRLSDGSTAREELTDYERPRHFAYCVRDFTGPLRLLTSGARGSWWFDEAADGATSVRWRYAFEPRAWWTRPILWAVVRPLWRGYMRAALHAARAQVEASSVQ